MTSYSIDHLSICLYADLITFRHSSITLFYPQKSLFIWHSVASFPQWEYLRMALRCSQGSWNRLAMLRVVPSHIVAQFPRILHRYYWALLFPWGTLLFAWIASEASANIRSQLLHIVHLLVGSKLTACSALSSIFLLHSFIAEKVYHTVVPYQYDGLVLKTADVSFDDTVILISRITNTCR